MKYSKYHALGNDYIVIRSEEFQSGPDPVVIRRICHRNYGVGSDGILLGPLDSNVCDFGVRIYNPDGSEAEKSGNGLRIFARFLFDKSHVNDKPFSIETLGGLVSCEVSNDGTSVRVEMGEVRFSSKSIPVDGPSFSGGWRARCGRATARTDGRRAQAPAFEIRKLRPGRLSELYPLRQRRPGPPAGGAAARAEGRDPDD